MRCKTQAYQDDQRSDRVLPWRNNGDTFQYSAPSVTQTSPGKRAPGKIRARWSNKPRYNPMKTKRPNTPESSVTNMDTTDTDKTKVPLSVKVCERFESILLILQAICLVSLTPKSQTGQMKIGLGDIQIYKSKQGRLTFYQTGTCPNPNLTLTLNWK